MSQSQTRIAELAAAVAHHTQRVDKYLTSNNLPTPSFQVDGPVELGLPADIEESRIEALQATQELNDLLQGPRNLILNHQHHSLVPLKFISQFDIAKKVPVDEAIAFKDLAASVALDNSAVTRILRMGIANRIFKEPRAGFIAHSAASKQIAEDARIASWVGSCVDEFWPAAQKVVDALVKWPNADEPDQTAYVLANDGLSFYEVLRRDSHRATRFGEAMSFVTQGEGFSLQHLTDGYPWDTIRPGMVVDVGGSHGTTAFAIARKYPHLRFIVQDLPKTVAGSREVEGLNVEFMAHNFFEGQPVKGADVYLFRLIMHNWPDAYCVRILKSLVPALKKGARVLIMNGVAPPPGTVPNNLERKLRSLDLTMLIIGNAKDREVHEWKTLFEQADARFRFKGVRQPPGSRLAIIEVEWD
ncbi:putative O-methyltransferase [Periconia macrospinosa]|uniref:Putative O-methyltransferase n=1 Tax=Periconia macrospinosa TaxID=97972 RepID=A0A2V1E1R1_9PLEO|nr:putative O-methyltransferase [Periconia macrospinosa]